MPNDFHFLVFWEPVFQSVLKLSIEYIDLLLPITFPVFLIFLRPIFSISMLYHSDEGSYHHPDNYGYKIFH